MTLPAPPRARAWTGRTTVLLVVCALIVAAAIATAALMPGYVRDGARRDAEATLRSFLDQAIALDEDWRTVAGPLLTTAVPTGAPLMGEEETADALSLSATYEIGELTFSAPRLERSDTASAEVLITYRYTVLGEEGIASIAQTVWLTRPFYYPGESRPQRAKPTATPRAVGPWRVVGITTADRNGSAAESVRLDLDSDERAADGADCDTPLSALTAVADSARIDGELASRCFLGAEDGSDALEDGLDAATLLEAFPAIDGSDPGTVPPELLRLAVGTGGALRAPLTQYLVADRFALTFAAVETDGGPAVRLVSIRDIEEER